MPTTVVAAHDGELVLWVASGTHCVYPIANDPDRRVRHPDRWDRQERRWHGTGVLHRIRHGDAHSLMHFWREDGSFAGWYVNLQDPLRPARLGFDTADHALDVWIAADGTWHWKDEDQLEQAVELELFSPEQADAIRAEGERVLSEWPFPTGWEDWRPDPSWPVPPLPAGWDEL
jgi:uncharacterized protein DUF402